MSVEQLRCVLADVDLRDIYEEYLHQNLAWENFGFYVEVEKFKKMRRKAKRKQQAAYIYHTFIKRGAKRGLGDLDHATRTKFQELVDEDPVPDMFDDLLECVLGSLASATIHGFLNDPSFTAHVGDQFPHLHAENQKINAKSLDA